MNNDLIAINQADLDFVRELCDSIADTELKNKAVANALAVKTAAKYFKSTEFTVDDSSGIYKFLNLLGDSEVTDLYVNGCYIDVRLYFSSEELGVPQIHFDKGIKPLAYMFIKMSQDLSSASVSGFIRPENVSVSKNDTHGFYKINEDKLVTFDQISPYINYEQEDIVIPDETLFEFADDGCNDKYQLIVKLLCSESYRIKLQKILKAKSIYNLISVNLPQEQETNIEPETITEEAPSDAQKNKEVDLNDDIDGLYDALDEGSEENGTEYTDADKELLNDLEYKTDTTPNYDANGRELNSPADAEIEENSEQIDTLFNKNGASSVGKSSRAFGIIGLLAFLIIVAGIGGGVYWWYNNSQSLLPDAEVENSEVTNDYTASQDSGDFSNKPQQEVAMPVETVENKSTQTNKEMGNSVAIPAIERNLDASVLVSNLKVDWEVPSGYVSNTAAKRYLIKLGKVIQLNLKTDLLLLNKPPISNRIAVEISFDPAVGKFVYVGIQASSGEKIVDTVIAETVKSALNMNLSVNTDSFAKLKGNPVLIIHL